MMVFGECIQKQIDAARDRGKADRTPANHNIGDFVAAVLAIDVPEQATEFFRGYLDWLVSKGHSAERAREVALSNVGWCYGEGMPEERIQIWREVTGAEHPIFGATTPSAEQAFATGVASAQAEVPHG